MTLIELTLVIVILLTLMGTTMHFAGNIGDWNKGRKASAALRDVYAAQRAFLADHPRRSVSSLSGSELIPYLPSGANSLPAVEDLNGSALSYRVTVTPPVLTGSGGAVYDPSGSSDDSLWDVGE